MKQHDSSADYSIPGVFDLDRTENGLIRGKVTTAACTAEIYLQGAHITQWHPSGHKPVLFLSERTAIESGKAIRGGIPIIFPWFGARTATPLDRRTDGPSHGFARTSDWQLATATMDGDNLNLSLTLEPSEISRSLGYDYFRLTYKLSIGLSLALQLTVENCSKSPMHFEEALHSYFSVGSVEKIGIKGLADTQYLDKTDGLKRKLQEQSILSLTGETDRPYLNTQAPIKLEDPVFERTIKIEKDQSLTTVIWNPWSELTAKLADMKADGWMHMVCIESANALDNAVTLAPGAEHTMTTRISVSKS